MLELTSKRPTMSVSIDGAAKSVPLTFTRREMQAIGSAEDKGEATMAFFASYLGDCVEEMGDDQFVMLIREWEAARSGIGEPPMGE